MTIKALMSVIAYFRITPTRAKEILGERYASRKWLAQDWTKHGHE